MKAKQQERQWRIHMEIARPHLEFIYPGFESFMCTSPMRMSSFGKQMKQSQGFLLRAGPAASFIVSSLDYLNMRLSAAWYSMATARLKKKASFFLLAFTSMQILHAN